MGRSLSPVGVLCKTETEKDDTGLSSPNAKALKQKNHDDGNGPGRSPSNDKSHVFDSKKDDHEKITGNKQGKTKRKKKTVPVKKDRESLHVWGIGPQWKASGNIRKNDDIQQQQADSGFESRKNTSVAVVSFKCCPNRRRIQESEASLGELFRVDSLVGTSGTGTTRTTEEPTTPCKFVFPNNFLTQKSKGHVPVHNVPEGNGPYESSNARNNPVMVVERIKNEYDCHRVATSVKLILSEEESDLTDDMEYIRKFGFNHIIIVGERDYGMLFLDCYGRMFDWDTINFLLWPLGNYLENKLNKPKNNQVVWALEFDGTITEFEVDEHLNIAQ